MGNLTDFTTVDGNLTCRTEESLFTNKALTGFHVSLIGLNILLSISAFLGNTLILIALHKVTSIYPPTKLLFRCLAVSDLCAGLLSQPLFCISLTGRVTSIDKKLFQYSEYLNTATSITLCAVSALASTAISVDILLALLLKLRYRHVVTLWRVRAVITCFWLLSLALGALFLFGAMSVEIPQITLFLLLLLCLLVTTFAYIKIYLLLRHQQQTQVRIQRTQQLNEGIIPIHVTRYKKTVSTIAWLQLALLVCYLPFVIMAKMLVFGKLRDSYVGMACFHSSLTILYFNSSLNPILYCWRIREVKQEAKNTIRQLKYCLSSNYVLPAL